MTKTAFPKLTVIELAGVLAGPAVGTFFSELGATVIKIENPNNPDVTRTWKLSTENPRATISAYFSAVNYHKQYVSCDLKNPVDVLKLHELVKTADIVITNFKNNQQSCVDYQTLSRINPLIIYAAITGYGAGNSRPAYDVILQAESGFMSMNGTVETGPLKMPVALIDVLTAHQLKEAILLALIKRERINKGSLVTVSLYESAIASLVNQASSWLMENHIAKPLGSLHPSVAPYGEMYTTADNKQIILAIGTNAQFNQLCQLIDLCHLPNDPKFINNQQRVIYRNELNQIFSEKFKAKEAKYWMAMFTKHQVPAGMILNIKEVFANSLAANMVIEDEIDGFKTKRVRSIAFDKKFLDE